MGRLRGEESVAAKAWSVWGEAVCCPCYPERGKGEREGGVVLFPCTNDVTGTQVPYRGTGCSHNCPLLGLTAGVMAGGQAGIWREAFPGRLGNRDQGGHGSSCGQLQAEHRATPVGEISTVSVGTWAACVCRSVCHGGWRQCLGD